MLREVPSQGLHHLTQLPFKEHEDQIHVRRCRAFSLGREHSGPPSRAQAARPARAAAPRAGITSLLMYNFNLASKDIEHLPSEAGDGCRRQRAYGASWIRPGMLSASASPRSVAARLAALVQHSLPRSRSSARAAQRTRSHFVRAAVHAS